MATAYFPQMMTPHEFKKRLKQLGISSTGKAAEALAVSRYAIMHWKAGRRSIPPMVGVVLDGIELRRRQDFLS